MLALIYCFVLRSAAVASGTTDAPLRLLFTLMCTSFLALLQVCTAGGGLGLGQGLG